MHKSHCVLIDGSPLAQFWTPSGIAESNWSPVKMSVHTPHVFRSSQNQVVFGMCSCSDTIKGRPFCSIDPENACHVSACQVCVLAHDCLMMLWIRNSSSSIFHPAVLMSRSSARNDAILVRNIKLPIRFQRVYLRVIQCWPIHPFFCLCKNRNKPHVHL